MALSAEQLQQLVVVEVGDVDAFIAGQIGTLWSLYEAETDDYLHYLLTKRKAIDLLQGKVREQVNMTADNQAAADLSDKLDHLQVMWKNVDGEIATLRMKAAETAQQTVGSGRRPLSGQLTARLGGVSGIVR